MRDIIVDEIRRVRQEHAAKFNFDLDAIFDDLKEKERQSERQIVSRAPRPVRIIPPTGSRRCGA